MAQQDRQGQGSQQKDNKPGPDSGAKRQGGKAQDDKARDRKDTE